MKIKIQLTSYLLLALTMVFLMSCGRSSEHEHDDAEHHEMEAEEHNDNEAADGHEHDMANIDHDKMIGEGFTWEASVESMTMMEYKTDNIRLTISGDEDVLLFEPAGHKASCMFKNVQSNVGVTATLKIESLDAIVKLLHHSVDKDNYEFVSLENGVMKLGRVENGEEKIFDSKEIETPEDWFTLTVTAAGTHYKGYLNDKMITHGHGDIMEPGLVGIVASGNGTVAVKKVEAIPLEEEN